MTLTIENSHSVVGYYFLSRYCDALMGVVIFIHLARNHIKAGPHFPHIVNLNITHYGNTNP